MANLEEDDIETEFRLLTPQDGGSAELEIEQHYLHSTDSILKIHQFPSEGLSFKPWPAATTQDARELNDDVMRDGGGSVHVAPLRWGEEDDVDCV
ncbi:hypothetical protein LINPERPRIM_LOCUS34297 [Linum perenne]